jgi:2-polyprenyl-3-methyl-5-hydroxy-6-metoxy-1,4-benzoquinol methylase
VIVVPPSASQPSSAGQPSSARQPSSAGQPAADETDLVRRGYDELSYLYRADDAHSGRYAPWIAELAARLPAGGSVLDLGCGCGVPVSRDLAAAGFAVTGADISEVQIARARRLVPAAWFLLADAARLAFADGSFDAVVCLYALIHMPLDVQPELLARIGRWLRPGGWLLTVTGQEAWTGTETGWLGGQAPMWWSHPGAPTYRDWIEQAGLEVTEQSFVPEGDGGHALFWAVRPA